ncbi:MAG: signal peptidase II [Brevinema sp.]
MKNIRFSILLGTISLSIFGLDMYTKWAILQQFDYKPYPLSQPISMIGEFFKLTYVQNYGITFGMLSNLPPTQTLIVLVLTSSAALAVLVYFAWNIHKLLKEKAITTGKIALAMIFGGALGNIIDRIMRGFVVDFLDFGIEHYRWYTFNFADVFIVSGCILLSILMIFFEIKPSKD